MQKVCITGGAGFIGSNVVDHLLALPQLSVTVIDDFRTGQHDFLEHAATSNRFTLVQGDVLDDQALDQALTGCDWVFHLQAHADVRYGRDHPTLDFDQNARATLAVLESMRRCGVTNILFSSTGSVYGEPIVFPTPETAPFPIQTSLYGASKLAGEGLIAAYSAAFGFTGIICRFVSILGERYTHGHVFDFYTSLMADPSHLTVLGDGHQEKSYLYVQDCVRALLLLAEHHEGEQQTHVYNLGTDETVVVDASVKVITEFLGIKPAIEHTGGKRGWIGDSPMIRLDTTKIRSIGWAPTLTIPDAIVATVKWLKEHDVQTHERA